MFRNTYVRLTQYRVPLKTIAGNLQLLAKVSESIHMFEGFLIDDVRIEHAIRLQTVFYDGVVKRERLGSTPVVRIENGYVLSERSLYQLVRVPPPRPGKFDAVS